MRSASLFAVSTCLLLVLAFGTMTQIVAQSTVWTVTVGGDMGEGQIDVAVNGMPYCIVPDSNTAFPNALQQLQTVEITLEFYGNVYEGTCGNLGALVGPIDGTLTLKLLGTSAFNVVLVFDVGPGLMNYHSEAKFTGDLQIDPCALKNVASEYAFVRGTGLGGIGLNLDLQLLRLEPESGECSFKDSVFLLPTFVFGVSGITVGGVVMPANMLALIAPWLAVIGLVGCIGTAAVIVRKRHP